MMGDVYLGLNRPATIPLAIWKKLLVVIGEVGVFTIPDALPPITHVTVVYCCIYLLLLSGPMLVFIKM